MKNGRRKQILFFYNDHNVVFMVIGNTFQRFPEKTRFFTFSARQEIVLNLAFLQNDCIFTESLWFSESILLIHTHL